MARRGKDGLSLSDAVAETGWLPARVEQVAAELAKSSKLVRFECLLLSPAILESLRGQMLATVDHFTRRTRWWPGSARSNCARRLASVRRSFAAFWSRWSAIKQLQVNGELVQAAGKGVVLRDEEAEAKSQIERRFAKAGLKVPLLKEVLAALPVDKVRAQKIVTLLLRDRVLVKLADELVFHRDALESCAGKLPHRRRKLPSSTSAISKTCSA